MSLFDDSSKYWDTLKIEMVGEAYGRIIGYAEALAGEYENGRVLFRHFKITPGFQGGEFPGESLFTYLAAERLFRRPEIRERFEEYTVSPDVDLSKAFHEMHPYELPGFLALILQNGGAYSEGSRNMKHFTLALEAALEMTGSDLNNGRILVGDSAWSDFFHNVAWDKTVVVFRPRDNDLGILLATDTD